MFLNYNLLLTMKQKTNKKHKSLLSKLLYQHEIVFKKKKYSNS